jgi:hypothetical protein
VTECPAMDSRARYHDAIGSRIRPRLLTTDHKRIGILHFFGTALVLLATFIALVAADVAFREPSP